MDKYADILIALGIGGVFVGFKILV